MLQWPGSAADSPSRVVDFVEGPRLRQPVTNGLTQRSVKLGNIGTNPGSDAGIAIPVAGVDIDAADDVLRIGIEHRVGERNAPLEFVRVFLQIGEVPRR